MFNTKKINELTEQLHQLSNEHELLRKRFNTYLERTKPEPKFKMFDEVTGSYYCEYSLGLNKSTITGKVTKITYDTDFLSYKYVVLQDSGSERTFDENSLKLVESKCIQFTVVSNPTNDPFDIGRKCPTTKQSKKKSTKAKRK